MDKIKKIARSTQEFVSDHKVGIAITATALACFALSRSSVNGWNSFLKEHDLYDEFYNSED